MIRYHTLQFVLLLFYRYIFNIVNIYIYISIWPSV